MSVLDSGCRMSAGDILLGIIKTVIFVYDILFGWVYSIFTKPWVKRKIFNKVLAKPCKSIKDGDTQVTYKPVPIEDSPLVKEFQLADNKTMAEVWSWVVKRYYDKDALGTREIVGEEEEVQSNGQTFKKYILGDYR